VQIVSLFRRCFNVIPFLSCWLGTQEEKKSISLYEQSCALRNSEGLEKKHRRKASRPRQEPMGSKVSGTIRNANASLGIVHFEDTFHSDLILMIQE
jgi:hypothetical protein